MIVFQDDLTKYLNDKEFYNLEYLTYNKKCWDRHFKYYAKKNYKRKDRLDHQLEQMDKSVHQMGLIQYLIDTY